MERWIPKRQTRLSSARKEGRETSVMDSSNFVDEGQSAPVNVREGDNHN